jgi:hypothetical protein
LEALWAAKRIAPISSVLGHRLNLTSSAVGYSEKLVRREGCVSAKNPPIFAISDDFKLP